MTGEQKEYIITESELNLFYECALIHDMPDAPTICAFIRSRPASTDNSKRADFTPRNIFCPNSVLCGSCIYDCNLPCNTYSLMAKGCEDEDCSVEKCIELRQQAGRR